MEMHYRTWGDPQKTPVILLHALACHSGWWKWVAPHLEKEYYLIAPDLRGHGQSPHAESYSFDDYAEDIEELARKFARPYAIVGHSMGGYVGLKVASRGVQTPAALLIADMKIDSPEEELAGLRKASQKSGRTYESMQDAVGNYKLLPPQHVAPLERVEEVAKECYKELEDGHWGERFDRRALAIENVESVLVAQKVTCPAWVVRGKGSLVMPETGAKEIARVTDGPLHEMEEAYHHLPLEVPEEFATEIRNFLVENKL
ncbi:alpha/beta fold hydrolase [Bacillus sp. FJAT-45350]|uniref:alpha/beta fold hydrolase n=1 Tax=Bacillus sp. FJAT-45350 TaxID=2011014 RepID=UPI0015CE714B|nr:alpha/beta hydrolase [Bacillus sp. FJAT-45350]